MVAVDSGGGSAGFVYEEVTGTDVGNYFEVDRNTGKYTQIA